MANSIIFKFRDELLYIPQNDIKNIFSVPNGYSNAAKLWEKIIFENIEGIQVNEEQLVSNIAFSFFWKNLSTINKDNIVATIDSHLSSFLGIISNIPFEKSYLFEFCDIEVFSKFHKDTSNRINDIFIPDDPSPELINSLNDTFDIPNFYDYFIIRFPEEFDDQEVRLFLGLLTPFLPHTNNFTDHLLDFAYLKNGIVESSGGCDLSSQSGKNQDYFEDLGINTISSLSGITGKGIKISTVEKKFWHLNHPELSGLQATLIFPKAPAKPYTGLSTSFIDASEADSDHGNEIFGLLKAKDSGSGDVCKGICPEATNQLASCNFELLTVNPGDIIRVVEAEENALLASINKSRIGDIILLEIQNTDGSPLEFMPAIYQLIAYANSRGIIIVEPAGNKGGNLRTSQWTIIQTLNNGEIWTHQAELDQKLAIRPILEKTTFVSMMKDKPSGAILVGATYKIPTTDKFIYKRLPFSNWAKDRVKIFAHGSDILSVDGDDCYKETGETSAASAIIAGCIVLVQGFLKAKSGKVATALFFEDLLSNQSLNCVFDSTAEIGKVPDLIKALTELKRQLIGRGISVI